jgi:hypothetical protein
VLVYDFSRSNGAGGVKVEIHPPPSSGAPYAVPNSSVDLKGLLPTIGRKQLYRSRLGKPGIRAEQVFELDQTDAYLGGPAMLN